MADTKPNFPKYPTVQVATPRGTFSFPKVQPGNHDDYKGKQTYKTTFIMDGDVDTSKLTEAALKIAAVVYPGRKPEKVNILIKDGDENQKDDGSVKDGFAGKVYLNASCNLKHPPKIVGPDKKPLPANMKVFGGDEGILILQPIPSDTPVKGTITFRLLAVQVMEKKSFGGAVDDDLFEDGGEGFGSGPADSEPSSGVDAGAGGDDDELPF